MTNSSRFYSFVQELTKLSTAGHEDLLWKMSGNNGSTFVASLKNEEDLDNPLKVTVGVHVQADLWPTHWIRIDRGGAAVLADLMPEGTELQDAIKALFGVIYQRHLTARLQEFEAASEFGGGAFDLLDLLPGGTKPTPDTKKAKADR